MPEVASTQALKHSASSRQTMHRTPLSARGLAVAALLLLTPPVSAQNSTSNSTSSPTDINTNCTTLWNTANGTGQFNVQLNNIGSSAPILWNLDVNSPGNPSEDPSEQNDYDANIFLGTPQGVDFYNGANGFSACAIHFDIPLNTIKRGQTDPGDCSQTLSVDCVNALQTRGMTAAQGLTGSTPIAEQGAGSSVVDNVCLAIESSLTANGWPSECAPFFVDENSNTVNTTSRYQLTFNTSSPSTCHISPFKAPDNYTFTNAISGFNLPASGNRTADDLSYDSLMLRVWPILTVVFPQANNSRVNPISSSQAVLNCLRSTNFARGSRAVLPLSPPTPVAFPQSQSGLGAGAVAGIVVLVIVILVGASIALWCLARNRKRKFTPYSDLYEGPPPGVKIASKTPWRQTQDRSTVSE